VGQEVKSKVLSGANDALCMLLTTPKPTSYGPTTKQPQKRTKRIESETGTTYEMGK
jgi:hypothetical protein